MWLMVAILTLFLGYMFRMLRTMLILKQYINKPVESYWISLGVGYLAEFFIPVRVFDIARTLTFSKISSTPWQLSIAVTVLERCIDFLFLAIILYFVSLNFIPILIIFLILFICICCIHIPIVRKLYFKVASIFNDKIKNFLLGCYWALFRIIKNISLKSSCIFFVLSLGVWLSYYISISFLSHVLSDRTTIIFHQFLSLSNINIWNITGYFDISESIQYSLYILIPIILSLLLGFIFKNSKHKNKYNIIPFLNMHDSLEFYDFFFNNKYTMDSEHYYQLIHQGMRISDLSAASDAKTFLMEENNKIFVRKIALNDSRLKLQQQIDWLSLYSCPYIPNIYAQYSDENILAYDIEYFMNSESFFTAVHYLSIEESFGIIQNVLEFVQNTYTKENSTNENFTNIYFNDKVLQNSRIIAQSHLGDLKHYSELIVNNNIVPNIINKDIIKQMQEYNDTLNYPIYQIHGDLTLENILIDSQKKYMIIDPSPYKINIFAEYAKLFQSLHAQYEHIKKLDVFTHENNIISYAQYGTIQYKQLFEKLKQYIITKYGPQGLKVTYFYEAICHIRTAGFMIKLDNPQAVLMIACAGNALQEWKKIEV